jgi:hypothetical protein
MKSSFINSTNGDGPARSSIIGNLSYTPKSGM